MIKITNKKDLEKIKNQDILSVVEHTLNSIFIDYQIDDISCFGSIFAIEDGFELENIKELGLNEPINRNLEFLDTIHLNKCNLEATIPYFALNNSSINRIQLRLYTELLS